jgi:hypothetical protein
MCVQDGKFFGMGRVIFVKKAIFVKFVVLVMKALMIIDNLPLQCKITPKRKMSYLMEGKPNGKTYLHHSPCYKFIGFFIFFIF